MTVRYDRHVALIARFTEYTVIACLARVGLPATERGTSEHSKMRQILSLKTVHLLGIFCLFYVGAEVTIGGKLVVTPLCFFN